MLLKIFRDMLTHRVRFIWLCNILICIAPINLNLNILHNLS